MDTSQGERTAILSAQLVEHLPYLQRVARSRVRDDHLAQEAVQATVVAALEGAHTFNRRSKLRTWLTGILLHKIHDAFRCDARDAAMVRAAGAGNQDSLDLYAVDNEAEVGSPVEWRTPDHALHCKQLRGALARALQTLPERQAEAFLLREISGLDTEQIVRTLGVSANNVWVLLHRARAGMRAALEREGYSCA